MKYFIVGQDAAKGTLEDDVTDTKPYFELGWEVVTTHFDVKRMKRTKLINPERDTLVTCSGREFLYRAEFNQVIDYKRFSQMCISPRDECVSLMEKYSNGRISIEYFNTDTHSPVSRYRFLEEDQKIIQSVELVDIAPIHRGRPYCCFLIRKRGHGAYRNMPDEVSRLVLNKLKTKYETVFIVGHGAEHFHDPPCVIQVDLCTYASLIRDELCDLIIGTMTGTMQLAAILSKAKTCIVMLNYDDYDIKETNHPVCLGPCITLSRSTFKFINPSAFLKFIVNLEL